MLVIHRFIQLLCLLIGAAASVACIAQTEPAGTAPAANPAAETPSPASATVNMLRKAGDSRWLAEELEAAAQWLEAGGESFLALWQPDISGSPKGALLMLHAEGQTANGRGAFTQLRRQLPEYGWATLSISLPQTTTPPTASPLATTGDTTTEEAGNQKAAEAETVTAQRISAAITYLQQNSQGPLVVLGEGIGAARIWQYMVDNGQEPFKAAILLNARNTIVGEQSTLPENLRQAPLPTLDVYSGEHFLDASEAEARQIAARTEGLKDYRQIRLGPQPEIDDEPGAGSRWVRGFLRRLFEEQ